MFWNDFWKICAVPAVSPWIEMGTLMLAMVRWIAARPLSIETPAARLNEKVVATNGPW